MGYDRENKNAEMSRGQKEDKQNLCLLQHLNQCELTVYLREFCVNHSQFPVLAINKIDGI